MLAGKHGGLNRFYRPNVPEARCCSEVLPWGGISGGTAELPRCNCKWIFICSGSWDERGSAVAAGLLPEGQISR